MFKAFRNFELCLIILAMGNCSCRPLACMGMDKKGNTPETWIRLYGGALVSVCFPVRFVCPSQSHQRCSIKEIAPPPFFPKRLASTHRNAMEGPGLKSYLFFYQKLIKTPRTRYASMRPVPMEKSSTAYPSWFLHHTNCCRKTKRLQQCP